MATATDLERLYQAAQLRVEVHFSLINLDASTPYFVLMTKELTQQFTAKLKPGLILALERTLTRWVYTGFTLFYTAYGLMNLGTFSSPLCLVPHVARS